jgi:hypothetical protein
MMMMMKVGVIREERRSEMVKDKTCHKSDDNAELSLLKTSGHMRLK